MTKDEVLPELHALVDDRLFGGHQWLVDWKTPAAARAKIDEVSGQVVSHLMMMFMGNFHPWEMISILQDNDLINQREFDLLVDRIVDGGADPEVVLIPFARRAYLEFFNPSGLLN